MNKDDFRAGCDLLAQPVLPLVSMVEFFLSTGDFTQVEEIVEQFVDPIETSFTTYGQPASLLGAYTDLLQDLLPGTESDPFSTIKVVDEQGAALDEQSARSALVRQKILLRELEQINSVLCGLCTCSLCCVGPDENMAQDFFEIPLQDHECQAFPATPCYASEQSRNMGPESDPPLLLPIMNLGGDGEQGFELPFYLQPEPALIHWQAGWSLILPRKTACPHLELESGRCQSYAQRPDVCRRPQIFPYLLEPLDGRASTATCFRLRSSLLAITDCPYVQVVQDEIAAYAAASELHLVLSQNKS